MDSAPDGTRRTRAADQVTGASVEGDSVAHLGGASVDRAASGPVVGVEDGGLSV